ncbi:MAG TPA: biotin/lipoyl-binding protein, partial [Steroidobacteraceae bacterium]|nr:biotin/lipoyl-binding protein [Steroidobacteraceae bacterium]
MQVEPNTPGDEVRTSRGRPSRPVLWAGIGLFLLIAIAWFIYHARQSQAGGPGGRGGLNAPAAVAVATATTGDIAIQLPALGTVTPLATVTVKTQISGQLQQIAFKEGQLVRQGEFLAQIDPRPFTAALEQVQGNLRRDQALLANARVDAQRFQDILAQGLIAAQQLDTQKALVQQYEGTVA